jgi:hypothetical protein
MIQGFVINLKPDNLTPCVAIFTGLQIIILITIFPLSFRRGG